MHRSKLKMFGKLYMKDLHEVTAEILVVIIGIVLVTTGFMLKSDVPAPVFIFPLLLLLGLAGFLPLIASFKLLSREWSQNTVYLIMSLPVSGVMILGAKMMVLLTQYIIGTGLIALSGYLLYTTNLYQYITPNQPGLSILFNNPELVRNLLAFYLCGLIFLMFLCSTSFFSQVTGKLSSRFSGLITAITFIITLVLSGKILTAFKISSITDNSRAMQMMGSADNFVNSLNFSSLSYLLLAIVIFILAVMIYDRKLEL